MVQIKSVNEIVLNMIDFLKVALPDLDVKPGTVARDLFADLPASQISLLYDELGKISNLQSLRLVAASDLDKLAQNFGSTRRAAVKSSGVALLTFSSIPAIVAVNSGSLITASNGSTFTVQNGLSIDPANANFYKSIAVKFQNDLSFLNITDQYAVEVSVQATTPGISGNVSKYALNKTTIPGVSNVTNVFPFTGGGDQENDATFRNRVLAIFSGSNIGTALGYRNLALSDSAVLDAIVIEPGDPLMTRDGTQVSEEPDGTLIVISEGTGGKIDIVILGSRLTQFIDTFIYRDKSNNNDPTDSKNDFILGQIADDDGKTITQKRIDDIKNATLPAQPVDEILEVTGSRSGTNFIPKSVDIYGRISGNFELLKDTGNYGGSPWGFDKIHWVSNKISFNEDRIKSKFNGQDNTTFSDVISIPNIKQNISITNENSQVSTDDRSIIQLVHTPATNVTRVFNVNTGERYIVTDQNLDGTSSINTTGRIQITGNTLPASSDILQVDYTWIVSYDPFSDYDGKLLNNNPRPVADSIDWGTSNVVRNERVLFTANTTNTFFSGTTTHPITSVVAANTFAQTRGFVLNSTVPNFSNRLMVNIAAIENSIDSIESLKLTNTEQELYNTDENDGIVLNNRIVVGSEIKYNSIIILPTDTSATVGEYVTIVYNPTDAFNITDSTGTSNRNQITIPIGNISSTTSQIYLDVTYISSLQDLLSVGITGFPISRSGNGFILNNNIGPINTVQTNTIKRENQTVQINSSNNPYITLTISSNDFSLNQVLSVIDIATSKEIWNQDFPGTITADTNGNFVLTFTSGFNLPSAGDNVLALYFANDVRRVQPFTFNNQIYKTDIENLLFNFTTNNLYVPIHNFVVESDITFDIIDETTGLTLTSGTDGYISSTNPANFSSASVDFSSIDDITGKTLRLINTANVNNKGIYYITNINASTNTLTIDFSVSNLSTKQISVIRIKDNKDLWTTSSTINVDDNTLNLPENALAAQGDAVIVIFFGNESLHQSPTKLSITATDQVVNSGIITAYGTTVSKVNSVVFTAINNGLKQNALDAFKTFLGLTSNSTISSSNTIIRVVSVEKVSTSGNQILNTLATYDVFGTSIFNNSFYSNEMIENINLQNTEFLLPSTTNNIANIPVIGDRLKVTFYYATINDSENVYFTKNGTLYTNKKFASLDQIYVSSGFTSSQSTRFTFSFFTQPATGSRYTSFYDYTAPKQNERILISYNYNKLIADTTFAVENARPINADVLVRDSKDLLVDAILNIVIKADFINSAAIVLQNVKDTITATINTGKLGDELNSSDLIAAAQAVSGVDRVRILYFNETGSMGQVLTLVCQKDQSFVANNVVIAQENR